MGPVEGRRVIATLRKPLIVNQSAMRAHRWRCEITSCTSKSRHAVKPYFDAAVRQLRHYLDGLQRGEPAAFGAHGRVADRRRPAKKKIKSRGRGSHNS